MWQQRLKDWLDSARARFARRSERTTSDDVEAYEGRYETIVAGTGRSFDPRRWAAAARRSRAIAVRVGGRPRDTHPPRAGRRPRRGRRPHQPRHAAR